jgi:CBS domain containing-hemolysin-like protein
LVTVVLGRLPKQGDWLPWGPFWLEVLEMDQHCVKELRITRTAFGVKQQDT